MENQLVKCAHCECELNTENDFYTFDKEGREVCESCEQSAWSYANTVIEVENGEKTRYVWCDDFGFRNAEYWEEDEPSAVDGFKYVRTDAWRGYWDVVVNDYYTNIASGWSTGNWDDVKWKHAFNKLVEDIAEGDLECPYKVTFAFGLTSNVFSVSSDILIKKSDEEGFIEWLCEEAGITIDEVREALR